MAAAGLAEGEARNFSRNGRANMVKHSKSAGRRPHAQIKFEDLLAVQFYKIISESFTITGRVATHTAEDIATKRLL